MEQEILKLRAEGKSYRDISKILGCSRGTVSYHCGKGQKEKNRLRQQSMRRQHVIYKKTDAFKYKKSNTSNEPKSVKSDNNTRRKTKMIGFQRRKNSSYGKRQNTFTYQDVINKFSEQTTCYLTGRPINLAEPKTYQFDHIIPASRGGNNTLDNLGIACKDANRAKSDLMLPELLLLCEEILKHHGYKIEKPDL